MDRESVQREQRERHDADRKDSQSIDSAIVNASKAAYLTKLIENGVPEVCHYDNVNNEELKDALITDPRLTKFNKLKKSNSEAFYYWFKVAELMDDKGN